MSKYLRWTGANASDFSSYLFGLQEVAIVLSAIAAFFIVRNPHVTIRRWACLY
jgi:hypothetical protein